MNAARAIARLRAVEKEVREVLEELEQAGAEVAATPRVMRIQAYAKHRDVSVRTVYRWIDLGLPVERTGKVVRIVVAAADTWDEGAAIARHAEATAAGGGKAR